MCRIVLLAYGLHTIVLPCQVSCEIALKLCTPKVKVWSMPVVSGWKLWCVYEE